MNQSDDAMMKSWVSVSVSHRLLIYWKVKRKCCTHSSFHCPTPAVSVTAVLITRVVARVYIPYHYYKIHVSCRLTDIEAKAPLAAIIDRDHEKVNGRYLPHHLTLIITSTLTDMTPYRHATCLHTHTHSMQAGSAPHQPSRGLGMSANQ